VTAPRKPSAAPVVDLICGACDDTGLDAETGEQCLCAEGQARTTSGRNNPYDPFRVWRAPAGREAHRRG